MKYDYILMDVSHDRGTVQYQLVRIYADARQSLCGAEALLDELPRNQKELLAQANELTFVSLPQEVKDQFASPRTIFTADNNGDIKAFNLKKIEHRWVLSPREIMLGNAQNITQLSALAKFTKAYIFNDAGDWVTASDYLSRVVLNPLFGKKLSIFSHRRTKNTSQNRTHSIRALERAYERKLAITTAYLAHLIDESYSQGHNLPEAKSKSKGPSKR